MSLLTIREVGDPVLRTKAEKVAKFDDKLADLLDNMVQTMYDAQGVGLAAPQVGISKRIVVIDIGDGVLELINPEIVKISDKTYRDEEGCLSIPGQSAKVERAYQIKVKAQDREGQTKEFEAEELLARVIQHEYDHLEGKLFTDYS